MVCHVLEDCPVVPAGVTVEVKETSCCKRSGNVVTLKVLKELWKEICQQKWKSK